MAESLGGLLALVSLAGLFVSIFGLFRPIPKLGLKTRGRAGIALVGSLLLMGVAGSLLPPTPADTASTSAAQSAVQPATSDAPEQAPAAIKGEVKELYVELLELARSCDSASAAVASALEASQNPYEVYPIVKSAAETCPGSWYEMGRLKPPRSARGALKTRFEEVLEGCQLADFTKKAALEQTAKVLDGDTRPSAVTGARQGMEDAAAGQLTCVAQFFAAAGEAGVPPDTLAPQENSSKQ